MSVWAADGMGRRDSGEPDDDDVSDGEGHGEVYHDANVNGNGVSAQVGGDHSYEDEDDRKTNQGPTAVAVKAAICLLTGLAFGFIIEKSRIFEPMNIRGQMVFRRLVYLKTMLSSVASGMFALSMMAMLPVTHFKFQRACNKFYAELSERGILACAVGGLIMGIGVTVAGSGPLILFIQLGADLPQAWYTLGGALVGTMLYTLLKGRLVGPMRPMITSSTNPWTESSYFITALPLVAMFSMLVFAFDILVPWELEVRNKGDTEAGFYEKRVWPPYVTGVAIGLLQYPLVVGAQQTLGGSTSYQTVVCHLFVGPLRRLAPHSGRHKWGFHNWWQIFYACGVLLGAYLSACMSDSFATVRGVPVNHAIWGGMLMTFGAHLAGGGVYEHGVTGMGLLSILSFIVMAGTFCGSICTAVVMRRYRILAP